MKTPKILIVDDEEDVLLDISLYLKKRMNCEIITLNNCEEAMGVLKSQDIDVLLQDLLFPTRMDGYGVIDYVLREKKDIIVLIISIWDDPNYMKKIEKEGSVYFVPKPLSLVEVFSRIETALEDRGGFTYKKKR